MTRAEKTAVIEELTQVFQDSNVLYLTDCSTLTVEQVNNLRGMCFEKGIKLRVVKNTLIRKAMERVEGKSYDDLYESLSGPTAIMLSDTGNVPAKLIKEYRKTAERPILKGAFIDGAIYVGDDQIDDLTKIKSKEELLGELIGLLESPMRTLLGQLNSGGSTIGGLLKALEERGDGGE